MAETDEDKPVTNAAERGELVTRIDELEQLLAEKKAATELPPAPRMKVGTDGIPVLVETVDPEATEAFTPTQPTQQALAEDRLIEDIINKVDHEITQDLDELINMLKDSIIDEVKARLKKELSQDKKPPGS